MLVSPFWQFIQRYVDTKTPKMIHTTCNTSTQKHTCYTWLVQLRNFHKYFLTRTWFGLPRTVTACFVMICKTHVLLQVGRAALCATPPVTCPVTSSLLGTQATLSHVRWIHPPSPSWLPPVLRQCWRSHGTPAFLFGPYISRALWCGLWCHSFCACPIRSSMALHARWLFTRPVLMCAWHGWTAGGGHAGPASLDHSTRRWILAMSN